MYEEFRQFAADWAKAKSKGLSFGVRHSLPELFLLSAGPKLALKYEAAGKVRVFAIADYWSQWVLKPIYDHLFDILRRFKEDATFDQEGVLNKFIEHNKGSRFWSYDLKSATDLISKELYLPILDGTFGPEKGTDGLSVSKCWSTILDRPFITPDSGEERRLVKYGRGQPMGMYSSWACLALLHHCLVHFAYYRYHKIAPMPPYMYVVLGDDIAIANEELARSYKEICEEFGITLSIPKAMRIQLL
jgi:hypothetical protein